jgi:thiol:disulfide interchange protein DsbD
LTISFLSYLTFSSCSDKKPDASGKKGNPFGITSNTETQILQPCHWSFTVEQSVNGEAILVSTAKLDSGWHLYSQQISDKRVATEFAYDSLSTYKLLGDTEEGKPSKKYDPYLEMKVLYFEKEAVFKQKIKVLSKMDFTITGSIDYMVCLTQCVNSDEEFSFKVKGNH